MATYASLKYDWADQLTGEIPTAAIADDAITLAKMDTGTDGNVITYDANGAPAVVATGTSGQVLTSAGANTVPTFSTPGGGKIVGIQRVTSTASGTFDANAITGSNNATQGYQYFTKSWTAVNASGTMLVWCSPIFVQEPSNTEDKAGWIATLDGTKVAMGSNYVEMTTFTTGRFDAWLGAISFSFTYTGWSSSKTLRIGVGMGGDLTGMHVMLDSGSGTEHCMTVLEYDSS